MNIILEEKLNADSRKRMKDSTFGLPETRQYPLNDANHVRSAMAFFNHCPSDKKHSLALKIIAAANKHGVKVSKDSAVWRAAHESSFIEESNDNLSVVLEADKKRTKDDDLDEEINDDDTSEVEDDGDMDPIDYTQDMDGDVENTDDDPVDYTADTEDEPGTMADDNPDEPMDYTQDLDTDEEGNEEDNLEPQDYTDDADSGAVEGDDDPQDYTQDINTDDSDPNNDNSNVKPEDPSLGGNTDNNIQEQPPNPDEGGDDDTAPTDYTQDIDGGDADNAEDNPVDGDAESPAADGMDVDNQNSDGTELQNMQNDAFSNLSPEQMKIKIANIKQSFIDLYNDVVDVLERLGTVNKSSDNLESINFSTMTLNELKTMLNDHLVSSFDTKSLVENQIVLQRFLAIYAMVVKILEKVSSKKNNSDDKK